VTVRDSTPPGIASLTASPAVLWPPNHRMVPVTLAALVTDAGDPASRAHIVSVSSSEPANGTGDGDTAPDFEVTGALSLALRAERAGGGPGRVYTIVVEAKDQSGNARRAAVEVNVPKSQRP